jgi:hypothetical protein
VEIERPYVSVTELQRIGETAYGPFFATVAYQGVAAQDLVCCAELVIELNVVAFELVQTGEVSFQVVVRAIGRKSPTGLAGSHGFNASTFFATGSKRSAGIRFPGKGSRIQLPAASRRVVAGS